MMDYEKEVSGLAEEIKSAAGANLVSFVLYGSAAGGEYHGGHSDLNLLGVFNRLDADALARLHPVVYLWTRKGHPAPLLLTLDELHSAADVFAIEFLDIRMRQRVLAGEDVFSKLVIPMDRHRHQVERELRINLLRLRQAALAAGDGDSELRAILLGSTSTFATLFRHALLALGEQPPEARRESFRRLAALLEFDAAPFDAVLDVREGKRPEKILDRSVFAAYLAGIAAAVEAFDKRVDAA
jgi:hypothetical protein